MIPKKTRLEPMGSCFFLINSAASKPKPKASRFLSWIWGRCRLATAIVHPSLELLTMLAIFPAPLNSCLSWTADYVSDFPANIILCRGWYMPLLCCFFPFCLFWLWAENSKMVWASSIWLPDVDSWIIDPTLLEVLRLSSILGSRIRLFIPE